MRRGLFVVASLSLAAVGCRVAAAAPERAVSVERWLAERYPGFDAGAEPHARSSSETDRPSGPRASELHATCRAGGPAACFALRDPGAYRDPRSLVVRNGCRGTWSRRVGELDEKKAIEIRGLDGGSDAAR